MLVLKTPRGFALFAFSAARRLDSGRVRRHLGVGKLRFATREELAELTGLVRRSVTAGDAPCLRR